MRWLVDNACSPLLAEGLRLEGHEAVHVRDYGIESAEDPVIFERAKRENRTLITSDTDFGTILALGGESSPSIVLFRRSSQRHPNQQLRLLLANLRAITEPLEKGSMVVIEDTRIRIHALPLGKSREKLENL